MADIPRGNRPLSPHLSVYKLPMAAITSIMTRITGQAMLAGLLLIVWWLVAAAAGPRAFATADWVLRSWLGYLVLFGSAWALWFHFFAGVRHLFYDAGLLLSREDSRQASWVIVVASVVMTIITAFMFVI